MVEVRVPATSDQLWDAIYSIYNEDGTAEKVLPTLFAKLIEFKRWSNSVSAACRSLRSTVRSVSPSLKQVMV